MYLYLITAEHYNYVAIVLVFVTVAGHSDSQNSEPNKKPHSDIGESHAWYTKVHCNIDVVLITLCVYAQQGYVFVCVCMYIIICSQNWLFEVLPLKNLL